MELIQALFYPVFVLAVTVAIMIFIPRISSGIALRGHRGLGDVIVVWLFQDVLKIIWFKNHGIWECANQHFLSHWLDNGDGAYFYFFPVTLESCATFTLQGLGGLAVGYGVLVRNVELYDFRPWFFLFPSTSHS